MMRIRSLYRFHSCMKIDQRRNQMPIVLQSRALNSQSDGYGCTISCFLWGKSSAFTKRVSNRIFFPKNFDIPLNKNILEKSRKVETLNYGTNHLLLPKWFPIGKFRNQFFRNIPESILQKYFGINSLELFRIQFYRKILEFLKKTEKKLSNLVNVDDFPQCTNYFFTLQNQNLQSRLNKKSTPCPTVICSILGFEPRSSRMKLHLLN